MDDEMNSVAGVQAMWKAAAMIPCDYVRRTYGVPARIGRLVKVYGRAGIIAEDRGHYIGVNFDDEKPGIIHNAHPVDGVEYGTLGVVRPMTRSQRRYSEYLNVADLYDSFAAFLRAQSAERKSLAAQCSF